MKVFKHRQVAVKVGQVWRKRKDDTRLIIHRKRDNTRFLALQDNNECHTMSYFALLKYWYLTDEVA